MMFKQEIKTIESPCILKEKLPWFHIRYSSVRYSHYCLLLVAALLINACSDIGEPDLSEEQIVLVAPADNFSTSEQLLHFFWEANEDALSYNLQIVYPGFAQPQGIALDTTIAGSNFQTILQPASYEWRVVGNNNFSQTAPSTRKLWINSDSTLASRYIELLAPNGQALLASSTVDLLWQAIPEAEAYRVQIAAPDFSNSTFIIYDELLATDNFTANLADGNYQWRVRAENTDTQSPYNSSTFTVDTEGPAAPMLTFPNEADTLASPIVLTWDRATDAVFDSVYIYTDNFSTLYEKAGLGGTSYTFDTGTAGSSYTWRCRSLDAAGNVGTYSAGRKFVIQ